MTLMLLKEVFKLKNLSAELSNSIYFHTKIMPVLKTLLPALY